MEFQKSVPVKQERCQDFKGAKALLSKVPNHKILRLPVSALPKCTCTCVHMCVQSFACFVVIECVTVFTPCEASQVYLFFLWRLEIPNN